MTDIEAVKQALLKYTGARKENLDKHDCKPFGDGVADKDYDGGSLRFDSTSCSLCCKHLNTDYNGFYPYDDCKTCPLAETLGDTCDAPEQPWRVWTDKHDPEPMIKALLKTLKTLQDAKKKKRDSASISGGGG